MARRRVEDLEPELLEVVLGVTEAAGHGEMRDVGDRVPGGQERRVLAGRPGLLQDDPPLVGLGLTARVPPGLLDQELREHLCPARVLGLLGTPRVEPSGSEPRGLRQLQGGGAGDRLHALPALLGLLARAGEELLGGGEVLVALDHRHHVQQVLVGAGEPHVQVLLAHEAVLRRVRGVRRTGRDLAYPAAPAQQVRAEHRPQHDHCHQDPENSHTYKRTRRVGQLANQAR